MAKQDAVCVGARLKWLHSGNSGARPLVSCLTMAQLLLHPVGSPASEHGTPSSGASSSGSGGRDGSVNSI